jgi:Txe/YoeB family toxin of Txe-Axe toxin-antitoxin module
LKLPSKVKFIDVKLQKAFAELNNGKVDDKKLYSWLIRAFEDIEQDAFCGTQIPKKQIPKEYIKKCGVHNCWKYDLPSAWRLIYSVENQEIVVVSIVLEWLPHHEYEKRFNYKA